MSVGGSTMPTATLSVKVVGVSHVPAVTMNVVVGSTMPVSVERADVAGLTVTMMDCESGRKAASVMRGRFNIVALHTNHAATSHKTQREWIHDRRVA